MRRRVVTRAGLRVALLSLGCVLIQVGTAATHDDGRISGDYGALRMDGLVQGPGTREVVLEDYRDIVTATDLGFDDFAGNAGTINKDGLRYGTATLGRTATGTPALRFGWNFAVSQDEAAFTGLFYSLFGLTDTRVTFDGATVQSVAFPEHSLDLDRVDGLVAEPGGPRRFSAACVRLTYRGSQPLILRVELSDVHGGGRFTRFRVVASAKPQQLCWDFRDPRTFRPAGNRDLDVRKAKVLSLVVERANVADAIENPVSGVLHLHRISFLHDRPDAVPRTAAVLLDLLERRTCEYFVDWSSRKPASFGFPQDRSTFGDLLTVGGVGFALPAYVICAERGWIPRQEAATRALSVLRVLADEQAFGPERVGRVGHRGWFYHFLGIDGRRKLNFDLPGSRANEALNTVELSPIDTGLALMGVLAAQSYFAGRTAEEAEIRGLAQRIYDRVDWPFMLDPASKQFYLGWKPKEVRNGPRYAVPDRSGLGAYSGKRTDPATLDYYTDEAFIVTLLAAGSKTFRVPIAVHCAWKRERVEGLIRTYPGSLFTYQFLRAFVDTRAAAFRLPPCSRERRVDWYQNSRKAIRSTITYAEANPREFRTYGRDAWGISALEGPDDGYRANGAPPVALDETPEQDGTIAYYAMLSAVTFGDDLRERAVRALRRAFQLGHWHPRFGLPDAFNHEVSQAGLPAGDRILRRSGPWVQRAQFAIDQGPMLLHLENRRSGLIWKLLARNPNIFRALDRLRGSKRREPDFQVAAEPSAVSVEAGGSATATILVKPLDGFMGAVDLWVRGLPSGASASFSPSTVAGGGASRLTLVTSRSTPVGSSALTLIATAGPIIAHVTSLTLTVSNPRPPSEVLVEGETGTGQGQIMTRDDASASRTVWLHDGESRTLTLTLPSAAHYRVSVRYSNDNFGSLELVDVSIDGRSVGQFTAEDTGNFGYGWNVFQWSGPLGSIDLPRGAHDVRIAVSGGDGYGVEIDVVRFELVGS